jgi:hypothetical protein
MVCASRYWALGPKQVSPQLASYWDQNRGNRCSNIRLVAGESTSDHKHTSSIPRRLQSMNGSSPLNAICKFIILLALLISTASDSTRAVLFLFIVLTTGIAGGQEKTPSGFTKSPTEHVIDRIDQPFVVRSVAGIITHQPSAVQEPLRDVLFEIQGPEADRKIRHTRTDEKGPSQNTSCSSRNLRLQGYAQWFSISDGNDYRYKKST